MIRTEGWEPVKGCSLNGAIHGVIRDFVIPSEVEGSINKSSAKRLNIKINRK